MDRYVEIVLGGKTNRGICIPSDALNAEIGKAQHLRTELYRSYYEYEAKVLEHLQVSKSLRGFAGVHFLPEIILDIDAHKDTLQHTLERARAIVMNAEDWIDQKLWRIWFSGRGFHLVIPDVFGFTPGVNLPEIVDTTLRFYFPECDPIYKRNQIIRMPHTINHAAKRFKIPLTHDEFWHLKAPDILEVSGSPRMLLHHEELPAFTPLPDRIKHPHSAVRLSTSSYYAPPTLHQENLDKPGDYVTCMQKLYLQGPGKEGRHKGIQRLASTWRRSGLLYSAALKLLQEWAPTLNPYEVERTVKKVYEVGYKFSCDDEVMMTYCDPSCVFFKRKNFTHKTSSTEQLHTILHSFYSNPHLLKINLQDMYALREPFNAYEGEFILVTGDTGLGKSAFVQNILAHMPYKSLAITTEFGVRLYGRRLLQIAHGWRKDYTEAMFTPHPPPMEIWDPVKHVTLTQNAPDLQGLRRLIREDGYKLIVADVVDGIRTTINDEYERQGTVARELKWMAEDLQVIIIGVHHISKHAAQDVTGARRRLTVHSGKGNSAFEDNADKVIGIEGVPTSPNRVISSLKARDESPFTLNVLYDVDTFRFIHIPQPLLSTISETL